MAVFHDSATDCTTVTLALAKRNFELLTVDGLNKRIAEISRLLTANGKESHRIALQSADTLKHKLLKLIKTHQVKTHLLRADVTDSRLLAEEWDGRKIDIVISDIPYGRHSQWQTLNAEPSLNPVWQLLESLSDNLSTSSVVAIASSKHQPVSHEKYRRTEQLRVGKRQIVFLKKQGL